MAKIAEATKAAVDPDVKAAQDKRERMRAATKEREAIALEWTPDELVALRQMLHIAVQAKGMEVAEFAVILNRKLEAALTQHQQKIEGANGQRPPQSSAAPTAN